MSSHKPGLLMRLGVLLALLLLVAACSPFGSSESGTATAPVATPGAPDAQAATPDTEPTAPDVPPVEVAVEGQLVEGGLHEPRTLNPLFVADPISEQLSFLLFNGLVTVDPTTGAPQPELAESWNISEDGTTYTFKLRDGVTWHDGQLFTARDVVFTYQTMMDERARSPRYARLAKRVRSVEATDPTTVRFELTKPDASVLTTIMTWGIVPEHVLLDVLPEELVTNPFGLSIAVGTGPFTLQQWARGDHINFQRFENYFAGPVPLQSYIYRVLPSPDELLAGLADGTIDWAEVDPTLGAEVAELDGVTLDRVPSYDLIYVALQLDPAKNTLFTDPRVRLALLLALDRESALEEYWHGQATIAGGTIPPASWAFSADRTPHQQNLEEAKRLLDEAGWVAGADGVRMRDGVPFRFVLMTNGDNPRRRAVADWLIRSWQELGITVEPQYETWSSVRERAIRTREFDALLLGYRWDVDPDQSALWASESYLDGFNIGHYLNNEVDELLAQAVAVEAPEERAAIYAELEEVLMNDLPVLPLVFPDLLVARSDRLQNATTTAILVRNRANIDEWVSVAGE